MQKLSLKKAGTQTEKARARFQNAQAQARAQDAKSRAQTTDARPQGAKTKNQAEVEAKKSESKARLWRRMLACFTTLLINSWKELWQALAFGLQSGTLVPLRDTS